MIALSLMLAGCHVFETVAIDCTAGMPCARGDADADTDADSDADSDTDPPDTGPIVEPSRGFVFSLTGTAGDRVRLFSPTGALTSQWTDFGDVSGPVAYDAESGRGAVVGAGTLVVLNADGTTTSTGIGESAVNDLEIVGDSLYAAVEDNVVHVTADGDVTQALPGGSGTVGAIGVASDGGVLFTFGVGNTTDLDRFVGPDELSTVTENFDGTMARARVVFVGPDDAVYTCTSHGAVHLVSDLAAGHLAPVVFYDGGLSDVTDCAWDAGDGSWRLISTSAGVVRVDAQGRGEVLLEPPSGYTLVRGNFY